MSTGVSAIREIESTVTEFLDRDELWLGPVLPPRSPPPNPPPPPPQKKKKKKKKKNNLQPTNQTNSATHPDTTNTALLQ